MTEPHRIRLRRPWQRQVQGTRVRWSRRFGRPTGLDPAQQVWIVLENCAASATVSLNGQLLAAVSGPLSRLEITGRLAPRNELILEFPTTTPPVVSPTDAPPCEVRLEIDCIRRQID